MTPKEEAYKMFEVFVGQFKTNNKAAFRFLQNLRKLHGFTITNEIENELEQLWPYMFDEFGNRVGNDVGLKLSNQGKKYINEFTTTTKLIQDIERDSAAIYNDYSVTANISGNNNQVLGGRDNAMASPIQPTITNIIPNNPKKRSWLEIVSWIVAIISGVILIYEFLIK